MKSIEEKAPKYNEKATDALLKALVDGDPMRTNARYGSGPPAERWESKCIQRCLSALELGADPNALYDVSKEISVLTYVSSREPHFAPLVSALIAKGADPNFIGPNFIANYGRLPLWWICDKGTPATALEVLAHTSLEVINMRNSFEETVLHSAARREAEFIPVILELLKRGADPNVLNKEDVSPLQWACTRGAPSVALLLLAHTSLEVMNTRDKDGKTILHRAAFRGPEFAPVVSAILARRIDPNVLDKDDKSSLWWACFNIEGPSLATALELLAHTSSEVMNTRAKNGQGILHAATYRVRHSNPLFEPEIAPITSALLARGADPFLANCRTSAELLERILSRATSQFIPPDKVISCASVQYLGFLALRKAITIAPDGTQVTLMDRDGGIASDRGAPIPPIAVSIDLHNLLTVVNRVVSVTTSYCSSLPEAQLRATAIQAVPSEVATSGVRHFLFTGELPPGTVAIPAGATPGISITPEYIDALRRTVASHLMMRSPDRTAQLMLTHF